MTPSLPDMEASALAYARLGHRVVPLHTPNPATGGCSCGKDACKESHSQGKHPRIADWVNAATTDPEVIRAWWHRWPSANIGLVMGAESRLFAVDVDGDAGAENLARFESKWGEVPDGPRNITGRSDGGYHAVFEHPGGIVRNKVALAEGIDVRGDGGLIVVEPSLHITGARYQWDAACHPLDGVAFPPAPKWIVDAVRESHSADDTPAVDNSGDVTQGRRNHALFRRGCSMRANGLLEAEIRAALLAFNSSCCSPPLPDDEVRTIAGQASKYERGSLKASVSIGTRPGTTEPTDVLETCTLDDRPPVPQQWLVEGIISPESCLLLAAAQKSGKTWWTFSLAISLVTGMDFFGQRVCRCGRVLLYTPESGWEAKRARLWGLCWGLGLDPREVLRDIHMIKGRINLTVVEHCALLGRTVDDIDPLVTIIDPFVAAAAGVDENSAGVVQPVLDSIRDAAATPGRAAILAHHHNKGQQNGSVAGSVRGSSAFGGWWDSLVTIRRADVDRWDSPRRVDYEHRDAMAPDPSGFNIVPTAHRDAPEGCTAFRLDQIDAPDMANRQGEHNKAVAAGRTEKIRECVFAEPGVTAVQLAEEMGLSAKCIRSHFSKLVESGLIEKRGEHAFPVRPREPTNTH